MSITFQMRVDPTAEELDTVARVQPEDVFITAACANGHALQGLKPVLLGLKQDDTWLCACLGFLRTGRFTRAMEIPWLPDVNADSPFWRGLRNACRELRVWDLSARCIRAELQPMPALGHLLRRIQGDEYKLRLDSGTIIRPSSENHRRNLTKAAKLGIEVRRSTDPEAVAVHLALMQASMHRRRDRGEDIAASGRAGYFHAMLQAGAGQFFQALKGHVVCSSVFILRSTHGAYYQSAGTSPQGMADGASPFLIVNVARQLQAEGVTCFDLGGVEVGNDGLCRFKAGFNAAKHVFEECDFTLASPLVRKLRTFSRLLREPRSLLRSIVLLDYYQIYKTSPTDMPAPDDLGRLTLQKLSDEQLRLLCGPNSELHRQSERLDELGYNDAYGVFCEGRLVHVSWLVSAEHDRISPEREIMLREGEMEITHAHTAISEGMIAKGAYCFAIRSLSHLAGQMGAHNVFMAVHQTNYLAQRGLAKTGARKVGRIYRLWFPFLSKSRCLRWRGHR